MSEDESDVNKAAEGPTAHSISGHEEGWRGDFSGSNSYDFSGTERTILNHEGQFMLCPALPRLRVQPASQPWVLTRLNAAKPPHRSTSLAALDPA